MKYYDGMGKDVTEYVLGLEARVRELELEGKGLVTTTPQLQEPQKIEDVGILEEKTAKPKRRIKLADTT